MYLNTCICIIWIFKVLHDLCSWFSNLNFGALSQAWTWCHQTSHLDTGCVPQAYGSAMERVVRKQWTQCLVLCSCVRCAQLSAEWSERLFWENLPMTSHELLAGSFANWGLLANDYLTFSDPSSKETKQEKIEETEANMEGFTCVKNWLR